MSYPIGYTVHVKTPGTQGGETRSYQVANALGRVGKTVHLYGKVRPGPDWHRLVTPHQLARPSTRAFLQLSRDFKHHDIHVVIERYQFPLYNIATIIQCLRQKPAILEVHGFPIQTYYSERNERTWVPKHDFATRALTALPNGVWIGFQRMLFKRISHFIVTSSGTKAILEKQGVDHSKITTIYNCVNPELFNPEICYEEERRDLTSQSMDSTQTVVYAGSLHHEELETVIQSIPNIVRQRPQTRFLFVGEESHHKQLERYARTLGLMNGVIDFRPPVEHHKMPLLLAGASVVLAPYRLASPRFQNGFHYSPLKIMEALAMEKAVVTVDAGELKHVFGSLPNVQFATSGSISSWAAKIITALELSNSPDLQRGREFILDGRQWEHAALEYSAIVERLSSSD